MATTKQSKRVNTGKTAGNSTHKHAPMAVIADAVPAFAPMSAPNAEAAKQPGYPVLPAPLPRQRRVQSWLIVRLFQSLDALVAAAAGIGGCMVASPVPLAQTAFGVAAPFLMLTFVLIWALAGSGAYRFEQSNTAWSGWPKSLGAQGLGAAATFATAWAMGMPAAAFWVLGQSAALALLMLTALHGFYGALMRVWASQGALATNVVIVGATDNARRLIRQSARCADINVVAVFDDRASRRPGAVEDVPVAGGVKDLLVWEGMPEVDKIIITVTSTASRRVNELVGQLRPMPQDVVLFMDLEGFHPEQARLEEIARAPMAYISGGPRNEARALAKRVQDVVFGTGLLVAFAPLMALVAVLVRLDSKGPALFRQKRHGFNNGIIEVLKFRTMRTGSDQGPMQQVQKNDTRVTRIGRFLRRTSLDELPQLFNVLGGSMSLVGPRPHALGMRTGTMESWKLVACYAHRHRVKPGLTGWAQINGSRGPLDTPEQVRTRVRLDLEYIRQGNFWLDIWIMLKTGPCLLGDSKAVR